MLKTYENFLKKTWNKLTNLDSDTTYDASFNDKETKELEDLLVFKKNLIINLNITQKI